MDELQISGKRYISTRRAGKEHGYHPDYIGQLIRGGKILGQKVGRSWYVDAQALTAYFNGSEILSISNDTKKITPSSKEEVQHIIKTPDTQVEKKFQFLPDNFDEPKKNTNLERDEISHHVPVQHLNKSKITPPVSNKLRYIATDEPLLPILEKKIIAKTAQQQTHNIRPVAYPEKKSELNSINIIRIILIGLVFFIFSSALNIILVSDEIVTTTGNSSNLHLDYSYMGSLFNFVKP